LKALKYEQATIIMILCISDVGTEIGVQIEDDKKRLSFLQKFIELQTAMITSNAKLTKPHPYSSTPWSWPLVMRGISFWQVKQDLKQIYLLGNPLIWWFSIGMTCLYVIVFLLDRVIARRGVDEFGETLRRWWDRGVGFFFLAWLLHWAPFFLMGRMLFVHHYLPSFIFSAIIATLVVEFVGRMSFENPVALMKGDAALAFTLPLRAWNFKRPSLAYVTVLTLLTSAFIWSFLYFSPLTYGFSFNSVDDIKARKWVSGWDFQHT
jgi:dolichyl-phosphate-mannose-protein mannosyltransferase